MSEYVPFVTRKLPNFLEIHIIYFVIFYIRSHSDPEHRVEAFY